jgi:hypothetical protein
MTDYTITTNFGAKDSLPSGNAGKVIKGSEFTTEFTNIQTALNTKADTAGDTFTGAVIFSDTSTFNDDVDINTTKVKLDGSTGKLALGTNVFEPNSNSLFGSSLLTLNQTDGAGNTAAIYINGVESVEYSYTRILSAQMGDSDSQFNLDIGTNVFSLGGEYGVKCVTTSSNPYFASQSYDIGPFSTNDANMDLGQSGNRWRYIYLRYNPVVTSDQAVKENIIDANEAGAVLDNVRVRQFDWIDDGTHQSYGVIAQELLNVVPEAVKVPEDEEGSMGVSYETFIPMLIKEVQSLRSRVAELENV